jgi:hypothetical protein
VDLLEKEMRRILQFLWWRSEWWRAQVGKRGTTEPAQLEGETAYASRQAAFLAALATSFGTKWTGLAELIKKAWQSPAGPVVPAVVPTLSVAVTEDITAVDMRGVTDGLVTPPVLPPMAALLRRHQRDGEEEEDEGEDEGDEEEGSSGEEDEPIGAVPLRPVRSAYVDT